MAGLLVLRRRTGYDGVQWILFRQLFDYGTVALQWPAPARRLGADSERDQKGIARHFSEEPVRVLTVLRCQGNFRCTFLNVAGQRLDYGKIALNFMPQRPGIQNEVECAVESFIETLLACRG